MFKFAAEFFNDIVEKYCIHCKVCLEFNPSNIFPLTEGIFPWYFGPDILDVQVLQEKPLLCAGLSGVGYGLKSLPPRAKYVRCIHPCKESRSCNRVKTYNFHEESEQV